MGTKLSFILLAIYCCGMSTGFASSYLTDEQITEGLNLASTRLTCEDFRENRKEKNDKIDYFTVEKYSFEHKTNKYNLVVCVGMYYGSNWGEIAVYPGDVNPKSIKYNLGSFSDLGQATAPYLSYIKFEYVPASASHPAYFILEKVEAGYKAGGKGYSQACTKYFLDKFIIEHTSVEYVFSDARNPICQHFFPKYGLNKGVPESFKAVKFDRPLAVPFYWYMQREQEDHAPKPQT